MKYIIVCFFLLLSCTGEQEIYFSTENPYRSGSLRDGISIHYPVNDWFKNVTHSDYAPFLLNRFSIDIVNNKRFIINNFEISVTNSHGDNIPVDKYAVRHENYRKYQNDGSENYIVLNSVKSLLTNQKQYGPISRICVLIQEKELLKTDAITLKVEISIQNKEKSENHSFEQKLPKKIRKITIFDYLSNF